VFDDVSEMLWTFVDVVVGELLPEGGLVIDVDLDQDESVGDSDNDNEAVADLVCEKTLVLDCDPEKVLVKCNENVGLVDDDSV
jgi:hypothetical protein